MQQSYHGSCQCGAVRYDALLDLGSTFVCNCSRCQRLGSVLSFTPRENFSLLSGEDNLSEYLFNTHVIRHLFCRTCGIQSFAYGQMPDGTPMAAINVNCLDGVDRSTLAPQHHDGKSS